MRRICLCDSRPAYRTSVGIRAAAKHSQNNQDLTSHKPTNRDTRDSTEYHRVTQRAFYRHLQIQQFQSEFQDRRSGDPNYSKEDWFLCCITHKFHVTMNLDMRHTNLAIKESQPTHLASQIEWLTPFEVVIYT